MTVRPCLTCNRLFKVTPTLKSRCADCHTGHERQRDQRRGSPQARGYGSDWQRVSREQRRREPQCRHCGWPGSPENPLQADHIVPKEEAGRNDPSNLQTLCRDCHNRKSAADRRRQNRR